VQVALLLRRQIAGTTRRPRDVAHTWGDGLQDRVDDLDRFLVTAHHQAIAALQSENPTAGTDVDVMQALLAKLGGPANIVAVVGVAAVDDDVAFVEQLGELINGLSGDPRRNHHPDRARALELADKLLQRVAASRTLPLELLN
jgi:hypothetical protein